MQAKKNRTDKKKDFRPMRSIKILNHMQTLSNREDYPKEGDNFKKAEVETQREVDLKNDFAYKEDADIRKLRIAKEEQIKYQEEQMMVKQKADKEFEDKKVESQKRIRDIQGKNVTTDSDGNLIFIKNNAASKPSQDFIQPILNYNVKSNDKSKSVSKDLPTHAVSPTIIRNETEGYNSQPQFKETRQKEIIQPFGSNFDLFVPEVGVKIVEGDKHKSGGNDFQSAFNKQSKYDYFSMMNKEQRLSKNGHFNIEDNKPNTVDAPSRQGPVSSLPIIFNKSQNKEALKLNNNIKTSLKGVLDALDYYPDYEEEDLNAHNNVDIFKKRKNYLEQKSKEKEQFTNSLEEINKFNYNIIKNNQWGQQTYTNKTGDTVRIPVKPSKKDLERELGKSIVNKRMPRSRLSTNLMKK